MADKQPAWLAGKKGGDSHAEASPEIPSPNPSARKPLNRKAITVKRVTKCFHFRHDYHLRFDILCATEKSKSGRRGPELIEEALENLFQKYNV